MKLRESKNLLFFLFVFNLITVCLIVVSLYRILKYPYSFRTLQTVLSSKTLIYTDKTISSISLLFNIKQYYLLFNITKIQIQHYIFILNKITTIHRNEYCSSRGLHRWRTHRASLTVTFFSFRSPKNLPR